MKFEEWVKKDRASKCDKDYKKTHRWKSMGVCLSGYDCKLQEIFQCLQCRKIVRIDLEDIYL